MLQKETETIFSKTAYIKLIVSFLKQIIDLQSDDMFLTELKNLKRII